MDKKRAAERAARIQKDEAIANKLLWAVTLAVLSVIGLMIMYRLLTRADTLLATHDALGYIAAFLVLLGAAGALSAVLIYRKDSGKIRVAGRLGIASFIAVVAAVCCVLMRYFGREIIAVLYVLLPGMAALYLVFYLYQREFFTITALTCAGGVCVWVLSRLLGESAVGYLAMPFGLLALALPVLAAAALLFLRHNGGKLPAKGKNLRVFPHGTKYRLMFLTCGLVTLALAGALVFGAVFAYYAMFVLFGFLFVMAVYYTVKLM